MLHNASLQIDANDVVNILNGGKIQGTGLTGGSVYSGTTPIFILNGNAVDGPQTITNGVLPIKLIYFRSSVVDDGISLEWASASEKDFDHYEITRSVDGKSFNSIAIIPGKAENGADYSIVDTTPSPGTNFYKLAAVDLDGSREEFQVIKEEWSRRREWITVYPNPVTDGKIHTLFSDVRTGSMRVLDCNGLVLAESALNNVVSGFLQLPENAPPGAYFILAETNGRFAQIKVIVK